MTERGANLAARAWRLLGSMPFAVAILVLVAVAASVGSLVEQNQPYVSHVNSFGVLWADAFVRLGLVDLYHAPWFLLLLGFLTVSTGLCVWRNTPLMLREALSYKQGLSAQQLQRLPQRREWAPSQLPADLRPRLEAGLRAAGYRWRAGSNAGSLDLSAKKGMARRLGYVLTHLAIVVISVGGLVDGNLLLQWRRATGQTVPAALDTPSAALDARSRVGTDGGAFRGALRLAPGETGDAVSLNLGDGYLLRSLPVQVRLERFHIDYHPTGQPRDFVSELSVIDEQQPGTVQRLRVSMNRPASYRGLNFFQSGFDDGGTGFDAELLGEGGLQAQPLSGQVGRALSVLANGQGLRLEPDNYRPKHVVAEGDGSGPGLQRAFLSGSQRAGRVDLGPSLELGVRDAAGQRHDLVSYLQPLTLDGRRYFVVTLRGAGEAEPHHLRLPLDAQDSLDAYRQVLGALREPQQRERLLQRFTASLGDREAARLLRQGLARAYDRFFVGGFPAVLADLDAAQAGPARQGLLEMMARLGLLAWRDAAGSQAGEVREALNFVSDSLLAYSQWVEQGRVPLLRVGAVRPVSASVLQVTHAPGAVVVYAGMALLALGVVLMVLCPERRLWVRTRPDGGLMLTLTAHRPAPGLADELEAWVATLGLPAADPRPQRSA